MVMMGMDGEKKEHGTDAGQNKEDGPRIPEGEFADQ